MIQQASRPSFLEPYRQISVEDKPNKELGDEERKLNYIGRTGGWQVLKEYIQELMGALDRVVVEGMEKGQPFEVIGQNTAVTQTAKEFLQRVIDRVENAKQK